MSTATGALFPPVLFVLLLLCVVAVSVEVGATASVVAALVRPVEEKEEEEVAVLFSPSGFRPRLWLVSLVAREPESKAVPVVDLTAVMFVPPLVFRALSFRVGGLISS